MSGLIVSWWREITGYGIAVPAGAIACLVLGAHGIPDRVARACYRRAAGCCGDSAEFAPDEVGQPVLALRCLRIYEIGTSLSLNMLVLLGAIAWLGR